MPPRIASDTASDTPYFAAAAVATIVINALTIEEVSKPCKIPQQKSRRFLRRATAPRDMRTSAISSMRSSG